MYRAKLPHLASELSTRVRSLSLSVPFLGSASAVTDSWVFTVASLPGSLHAYVVCDMGHNDWC